MQDFLAFTVVGIVTGSIYAIAASGLVVTYTTSGVFNFAHGAIGMVAAFLYWQVKVDWDMGTWPALIIVLAVFAPLFGILIEKVLMRPLAGKPTGVSLVVTVGLLVLLYGIATSIWPGTETRRVAEFFQGDRYRVFSVNVSAHQIIVLLVTLAVAAGLRFVLFRSRVGVAMRAVVDNPELAALNGALPERVSQLAWVMGSVMASLAGVLIAPGRSYSHLFLTLLVVNGYAAAILGRLASLPLTFVGALALGLGESYLIGYGSRYDFGTGIIGTGGVLPELFPVLPTVFLFAVIVALPQTRLRVGRLVGARTPRVPGLTASGVWSVVFIALAGVATAFLSPSQLFNASSGMVVAMVMLSLVVLVGYAGQVSLCQYTFVGIGAATMGKYFASGSPLGVVAATVAAAAFGALVALPALRLRDIYLALATVAFAVFGEKVIFDHPRVFDRGATLATERLHLGSLGLESEKVMFVFLAAAFAGLGVLVLTIRRGPLGRRLAAMNDSPAACMTLGLDLLGTKVTVFAISAGMAGFAGAMFGNLRQTISGNDFLLLISLITFLLAMIGGITTVTGAFIGGMALPILAEVEANYENLNLQGLFIGAGAILISRLPNGFAGLLLAIPDRFLGRAPARLSDEPAAPPPVVTPEAVPA
jgi:branched-chain amino acid transport system permease protein